MKNENFFYFLLKWYASFCTCLNCAFDGDIPVVKQRDVFYNALTQTYLLKTYNNAFIGYIYIALFGDNNKTEEE